MNFSIEQVRERQLLRAMNPPIVVNDPFICHFCRKEFRLYMEIGYYSYLNCCLECQKKKRARLARRRELYRLRKARTH